MPAARPMLLGTIRFLIMDCIPPAFILYAVSQQLFGQRADFTLANRASLPSLPRLTVFWIRLVEESSRFGGIIHRYLGLAPVIFTRHRLPRPFLKIS